MSARRKKSAAKQSLTFKQKRKFRKVFKRLAKQARQLELQLVFADGSIYPREGRVFAVDRQISPTTLIGRPFTMIVFPASSWLDPSFCFQNELETTAVAGAAS